jgi:hypothetical protein
VVLFGSGTLLREGEGSDSGTYDLSGDEFKEGDEVALDEGVEGKNFGNRVR